MTDTEETPSQRQARLRREKREKKLREDGQDRLDKITRLSGRTPESMRSESPIATPPRTASPAIASATPPPANAIVGDPEQMRAQEEYIRAFLRGQGQQEQAQSPPGAENEDPMVQMLNSMLGGMNNDPNAPGMPAMDPDALSKATGIPSFLMDMFMGSKKPPPTPAQQKASRMMLLLHILFAMVAATYLVFKVGNLTSTFGEHPPAPPTFQSPLVLFATGEVILHSTKIAILGQPKKRNPMFWYQTAKEIGRDASILIFTMGIYSWWHGLS